jgi:hypothetical protein
MNLIGARFLLTVMLILSLVPVFSQTGNQATQHGANCFSGVFEANAPAHNIGNAYLLMYTSFYTYENRINAADFSSFRKKFQEQFQPLGMKRFDVINISEKTADTQAVIMSNDELVIVSFRGSESSANQKFSPARFIYDWLLTDFNFFKKHVMWWGWGVKVHRGFYNAVDVVYDQLKSHIEKHLSSKKKLWITGHSLGAGIAPLAAFRLVNDGIEVQGIHTFAGPRIANASFARIFAKKLPNMQRWVYDNDIVTKLPCRVMKFQHLVAASNIYAYGRLVVADEEMKGPGKVKSHSPGIYLQKIYDLLPLATKDRVPPPPAFGSDSPADTELENLLNSRALQSEEEL